MKNELIRSAMGKIKATLSGVRKPSMLKRLEVVGSFIVLISGKQEMREISIQFSYTYPAMFRGTIYAKIYQDLRLLKLG